MKRRPPAQGQLFEAPAQRRRARPEPLELYMAVLRLRFCGVSVYRFGRDRHIVARIVVSSAELMRRGAPP